MATLDDGSDAFFMFPALSMMMMLFNKPASE